MDMIIRKILLSDNAEIAQIIRAAFIEFGLPLEGTTYEDPELEKLFETYQASREVYYILEENGRVLGGGGIKQLQDSEENICELQKMYFDPEIRGKGYGKLLFDKCLEDAKVFGYDACYLESSEELGAAVHLYEKNGFKHLAGPLGNTGHSSCGLWMIKDLNE